jgi:hypothetical protein
MQDADADAGAKTRTAHLALISFPHWDNDNDSHPRLDSFEKTPPNRLIAPNTNMEVPKHRLSWKSAPSKSKLSPPSAALWLSAENPPTQFFLKLQMPFQLLLRTLPNCQMVFVSWSRQLVKMVFVRAPL